ncbi:alpha/beta hydrolase [Morganella morganii]|uniref:alpha/beta hydrolase n=1 Tax=Morganella morganii TaxID=582 RepID=UPI00331636B4
MWKKIMVICCMMAVSPLMARPSQEITPLTEAAQQQFTITHHEMQQGDRHYRLFIAQPKQLQTAYTVLYMLDGNGQFPMMINRLSAGKTRPLPLVVGIGYPSDQAYPKTRTFDYTPPATGEQFAAGGGELPFRQFIREQVIPWVSSHYSVNDHRYFFGHSLGGLFVLRTATDEPGLFTDYISASPSLWWGNGTYMTAERFDRLPADIRLTITQGGLEEKPDLSKMSEEQKHNLSVRYSDITAREVCEQLQLRGKQCQFLSFPGKSHGSVIPDALETVISLLPADKEK